MIFYSHWIHKIPHKARSQMKNKYFRQHYIYINIDGMVREIKVKSGYNGVKMNGNGWRLVAKLLQIIQLC